MKVVVLDGLVLQFDVEGKGGVFEEGVFWRMNFIVGLFQVVVYIFVLLKYL